MVTIVEFTISRDLIGPKPCKNGRYVNYEDYAELEAENARLRQQRDAANAQLDFILETLKEEKAP